MDDRYEGRPFLRLLECFVLKSIGCLSPGDAKTLRVMAPKLRDLYRRDGEWYEIVAAVMEFPAELESRIREVWIANSNSARERGDVLAAEDFARMFVDTNFPTTIES